MNFQQELRKWPGKIEMHFGPDQHGKWRVVLLGRKIWGFREARRKKNMSKTSPRAVSYSWWPSSS